MPTIPLVPGSLGYTCYPPDPQTLYNDMFSKGAGIQASTLVGVYKQDTPPTDTDAVWIRTNANRLVVPNPFLYFDGAWWGMHPIPAGTLWAFPYVGTMASITTLDGGDANPVSANSGPFWEVVPELAARFPIGVGTLPSGTALAQGDTGGEEKHVLLPEELPSSQIQPHANQTGNPANKIWGSSGDGTGNGAVYASNHGLAVVGTAEIPIETILDAGGEDKAHGTMPPYLVLNFLKRTARMFCSTPMS